MGRLDSERDWSALLWSPELTGQCGRPEQAAAAGRPSAPPPGPCQPGNGHSDRTALPRSASRLLEFHGHVLMLSRDPCRPMPDASIRLVLKDLGKRIMRLQALRHARALVHRRADQRMTEPDCLQIEVDDRCSSRRLEKIETQRRSGDDAAGA